MTNISLGQTIDGSLSSTDTKNPKKLGSFSDEYTLTGISNWQQVQVNMDSTAIDSYLQLVNASTGEVIAFNDDLINGRKNSQLSFTVVPGVNYAIRATSLSPNETGNYTFKTSSLGIPSSLVSTNSGQVGIVDSVGRFVKIGTSPSLNDIALSSDNKLFGITARQLYTIDPDSGLSTLVGNLGTNIDIVGLAFSPTNVLYATGGSNLYTINQTTGAANRVVDLGSNFKASGDLLFDPASNRFLATSAVNSNNNSLFSISLTGQSNEIGDIGFSKVFGLSSKDGNLFGFTGANQQIIINPLTGKGTFDKEITGLNNDYIIGAASIPSAILTPTPPTVVTPTPTPPTVVTPTPTPPTVVTPTPTPPTVVTPTPTPPTVVTPTPTPLTVVTPTQTSTVPPSQIPKPDSSGEVDLDPLKLKVINGQFTFNEKTKRYEASGTIQIGRKDGKFPLINVQQGKVEYDDKTVSVDGIVFSSIGNVTPPLFKGKFDLDVKTATATSVKEERGSLPTEFKLSGLDIDFKALALNRDGIGLGVKFKLPNTVGGIIIDSVAQSPDTIFIGEKGPRFDTTIKTSFQDFSLLGLLPVTKVSDFSIAYIPFNETLKIQGKFSTKPFIKEEENSTTKPKIDAIPEIIADLSGENFIQIKDGKTDIKGSLGIKNLKFGKIWGLDAKLTLDTINKDIGGDAKLTYAFGNGVPASENTGFGLGLGFKLPIPPVELNRIKGELDLSNFPIFNTGFYLQEVAAEIDNIAPSDPDPFQLTLNGRVTAGPEVSLPSLEKPFSLFDADLTLIAKADRSTFKIEEIKGSGKFKMLSDRIGKFDGGVTLNLNKKTVDFQVGTSFFEDFIKGELGFKTDFAFKNINGTGNASINIPQSVPLFGGQKIGEGKLLLDFSNDNKNDNDFVAGWGRLDIKKLGVEISFVMGAKRYFDGRIERIGAKDITATNELQAQSLFDSTLGDIQAKNIPETNSFIVSPGTKYIILGADSENTASNMAMQVKAPNGKIFNESDFAATGNIAVVDELTDSNTKSVIVLNPEPGVWNINVANPSGLGKVQYTAVRDSEAPTIQVAAPSKDVSGQNVTINYNAFDADSTAKVSLFYDTDNKGFDGILIKGGLEEKDGAGNFVWNTQGIPTGDYYVYAMAMDENNAPVFSYAPLPINVTESADLSVTKTADRDTAIPGSNVTYTVAVTNNGTDNAKGAILTETLPEGAKFVSANIAPTKQSGNELTFDLGDVAKGQISTVNITVTAPTTGNLTSTSSITSKTFDPDISNDFDFASTTVTNDGTESTTNNVVATPTPTPPRPPLRQVLGTPENDNLVGIDAADSIVGFAGDDTLAGLGGDDIIYGNKGNDIITGNSGNDNIFGGRGNDLILGGADNDRLKGNEGDDTLSGDLGRDILIGGPGSDTFVLPKNAAVTGDFLPDAILDFQLGVDKIGLTEGLTQANLLLNFDQGNTVIKIAGSNQILGLVVGVTPTQLSGSFVSINLPLI